MRFRGLMQGGLSRVSQALAVKYVKRANKGLPMHLLEAQKMTNDSIQKALCLRSLSRISTINPENKNSQPGEPTPRGHVICAARNFAPKHRLVSQHLRSTAISLTTCTRADCQMRDTERKGKEQRQAPSVRKPSTSLGKGTQSHSSHCPNPGTASTPWPAPTQ